jgi:hypothetical protein
MRLAAGFSGRCRVLRLTILLAVCVLAGCGHPEKNNSENSRGPAAPAPAGVPKYRGSGTSGAGLQAQLAISAQGDYTVYFMDAAGDDLPAAEASDVSVQAGAKSIALQMNDTGETWIGKGSLPATDDLTAHVAFSAAVSLVAVDAPLDYVCPMDPDERSATPGKCPRCGMTMVMGIPDPEEYPMHLRILPARFEPREKVDLVFSVENPDTGKMVSHFETVHERLFHLFIVSGDLQYFVHDHPKYNGAGEFHYATAFPKPGMYRVLGDYYPSGGTPQFAPQTIFVPGEHVSLAEAKLTPDIAIQKGQNSEVELTMDPPHPVAGTAVRFYCRLKPADGLEKYLGAWAHMLAASDDLIDLLHEHPFNAENGQVEFDMTFPRARTYRVWVQFQRKGVVNTVAFNVPIQSAQP